MAFWGVKLNECDDFCRVYDDYIHNYEVGIEIKNVTSLILKKYIGYFKSDHNVYFAIAKAQWTLGALSEDIRKKVNNIIDSGENILYYRSLGFSENELNDRQKALNDFKKLLEKDKKASKIKRISPDNIVKRLPKGTVGWYEYKGLYYGFIVLDAIYEGRLLAITNVMSTKPENAEEVMNSSVLTAIWLLLKNVQKNYHTVGSIDISADYNGRAGVFICKPVSFGINYTFNLDECHRRVLLELPNLQMKNLLDRENVPIKFYNEETMDEETAAVKDLLSDPASKIAKNMIKNALSLNNIYIN
ncbi:MAG: hypothetical protein E7675_03555 [Ruminococcaceae bacterium]|nr:hypothetical protein [Oscillospiraceae bacterium]